MRDLPKDWMRWSKAERFAAVLIIAAFTIAVPALLLGEIDSAAAHISSHIGRAP